ncbi:DNA recombination protein RmuC [Riemerella columbina]|uniref:DNA recombination protein RmuC n=1 Tax=Riemerella columbina TaxID=103810 RepID=UPI002670A491|nr:DNA recombination protein RmuC [Riemerella columbina]WKS95014.1 DNA recombination protein RmuC [Riemerella columbina]
MMVNSYIFIFLILGIAIGAVVVYFVMKSGQISRSVYDELNQKFIATEIDLKNQQAKAQELNQNLEEEKALGTQKIEEINRLNQHLAQLSAQQESQSQRLEEVQHQLAQKSLHHEESLQKNQEYYAQISELLAKNDGLSQLLATQKKEIEKIQEEAKLQFENIANKILEEKTEKFTAVNQTHLKSILEPLGENLESFKKRVNEVYENESRERFSLSNVIKLMMEQTTKVSQEANNLASALKGQTKTQGDWGEMILERILEDSGLTNGREYVTQYHIKTEDGDTQRPDFVLKLPGKQMVIIDSKVSLNAYERMVSSENEEERKQQLQLHLLAIKNHIDTLAKKRYDNIKESLDFTIMFVPIEPAFLTAVQHDSQLWNYAYRKHIILLSPTNLIAYLKLISDVWKRADQNQNAEEIARQAGALYDKFEGFINDLLKIGKKMDDAKSDYENAMKKLSTGRGNLVSSAQKLKNMGATSKKALPEALVERAQNSIDSDEPSL